MCENEGDGVVLIADLGVRGVWQPQVEALFDVRVTDTDAPSYVAKSVSSVLAAAEEEKKGKYGAAVEARHLSHHLWCQWMVALVVRLHFPSSSCWTVCGLV